MDRHRLDLDLHRLDLRFAGSRLASVLTTLTRGAAHQG